MADRRKARKPLAKLVVDMAADLKQDLLDTQRELEISREHYANLFDLAPVGFITLTMDGVVREINLTALQILGRSRSQLVGLPLLRLIAKPDRIKYLRHITWLRRLEPKASDDLRLATANEKVKTVHFVSRITMPTLGAKPLINMAVLDITQRKNAENALRDSRGELEQHVDERTKDLNEAVARLYKEMERRLQLEQRVLQLGDIERRRLGQDLHDGLGQHLAGIHYMMESLCERLRGTKKQALGARILKHLDDALTETRNLAKGLYPVDLDLQGLPTALQRLCASITERFRLNCQVLTRGVARADREVERHMYRIAQEAVNNSARHARCKNIIIRVQGRNGSLTLTVTDDGIGIPDEKLQNPDIGLDAMQSRARLIGATLEVGRGRRHGTVVTCQWPLKRAERGKK